MVTLATMKIRENLRNCQLCTELDDTELDELASICRLRTLSQGEILFLEGDPAPGFFLLLEGRVRVYKSSPEGKEYTLHQIEPGQLFAEAAVFKGRTYPANASALTDSAVALVPKAAFLDLLKRSPEISVKMIGSLAGFLRQFNRTIEDLSLRDVPSRLASFLLDELQKTDGTIVHLHVTKTELANQLGTVSETLSRNFRKMRDLGVIEVSGTNIEILDTSKLQDIASGEKI